MAKGSQPPERSVLVTRPTNEFYGIYVAAKQRQPYLFVVAFMTILAEFLPILLANVPYAVTQVHDAAIICARFVMVILVLMLLTLLASFFINWPYLPVDPRTIAGALYYITDSYMLKSFGGLALLDRKDKDLRVKEWGDRYYYGGITGRSGKRRMGVEKDVSLTNEVDRLDHDTAYRGFQMGPNQLPAPAPPPAPLGSTLPPLMSPPPLIDGTYGAYPVHQDHADVSRNVRTGSVRHRMDEHQLPAPADGPGYFTAPYADPADDDPGHHRSPFADPGNYTSPFADPTDGVPPPPRRPASRSAFGRRYEDLPQGAML